MRLRIAPVSCVILAAVCAVGPSRAQEAEPVVVTNFPEVQTISGRVVVAEPIPQSRFETVKALVAPAGPAEANQWTEAGVLETQGFSHVTLSLAGTLQGSPQAGAEAGPSSLSGFSSTTPRPRPPTPWSTLT